MSRIRQSVGFAICVAQVSLLHGAAACDVPNRWRGSTVTLEVPAGGDGTGLERAWACLAEFNSAKEITVSLPAGRQQVRSVLVAPPGLGESTVHVVGAGEQTIISGTAPLAGWTAWKDGPSGALEVAVPASLAALMRQGWVRDHGKVPSSAPPELIVDGQILALARWPKNDFLRVGNADETASTVSALLRERMPVVDGQAAIAQGFWFHDWADSSRVVNLSVDRQTLKLKVQGEWPKYGIKEGGRFALFGLPAFLARPLEYAILPDRDAVVFIPPKPPAKVELTSTEAAVRWSAKAPLHLDGVTVEGFRGTALEILGNGAQLRNCQVRNVGITGVRIAGQDGTIERCVVSSTGGVGVELKGGDRRKLIPGGLKLTQSSVSDFGRLVWSSVPGVRIDGVGNEVSTSQIHDGPHAGIFYFGNDHLIADNEVFRVAKLTGDVGAIYTGRDWAGRGHKVLRNYVHDVLGYGVHGATAMYIDDQSSGVELRDNVVWNVDRGVLIGGGRDNVVEHNAFVRVRECIKADARGLSWQAPRTPGRTELEKRLRDVPFEGDLYRGRYPGIDRVLSDRPGAPVGNVVTENIGVGCSWNVEAEAERAGRFERNESRSTFEFAGGAFQDNATAPPRDALRVDWGRLFPAKR